MPEYLAPAVYVEEIDTGNKPIEGVSTSTAGMIGVTERGPAGVPILVTSYGEYVRWFGERLNRADFGDHCYLPHAVDGFFTNGGKRVFITRVEANGAARASFELHDHGGADSASTLLLRARTGPVTTGIRRFMFSTSIVRAQARSPTAITFGWEMTAMRSTGLSIKSNRRRVPRMCR